MIHLKLINLKRVLLYMHGNPNATVELSASINCMPTLSCLLLNSCYLLFIANCVLSVWKKERHCTLVNQIFPKSDFRVFAFSNLYNMLKGTIFFLNTCTRRVKKYKDNTIACEIFPSDKTLFSVIGAEGISFRHSVYFNNLW